MMRKTQALVFAAATLSFVGIARADDPFAGGADALAVKDSDGSSSMRAKLKLAKMEPDMIQIEVLGTDDKNFPHCVMSGKVIKEAASKEKYFKLIGRGKSYKFTPELKTKGKGKAATLDLKDDATQSNLGACYYPPKTKLIVKVGGVDMKAKTFNATAIYLK
jgi:hypothetical protein